MKQIFLYFLWSCITILISKAKKEIHKVECFPVNFMFVSFLLGTNSESVFVPQGTRRQGVI